MTDKDKKLLERYTNILLDLPNVNKVEHVESKTSNITTGWGAEPWDEEMVKESVNNTGKALVLHEATMTGGVGGEISARIHEECWRNLDAPVVRTASLDTAFPFAADLEKSFMANDRLEKDLKALLEH